MKNLAEKAVKGTFWSGVDNWGSQIIGSCVMIVLARLLGPEAFGLIATATAVTALLTIFQKQGFGQAIVQRESLDPEHLNVTFMVNVGSGLVLAGLMAASAGPVATFFGEPELARIVRWLSISLVVGALGATPRALLQRRMAFKSLAVRSLVASSSGGIVGVAMALSGMGVWSLVGQNITNAAVSVVVLWVAIDWRPGLVVSRRHFRELFSYGANVTGIEILNFLSRRLDDVLIMKFLGKIALGHYALAYRLLTTMTQVFTQTVANVALPTFSRLQHNPTQMRSAFYTATRLTCLVAFPAFVGVAVLAPQLVYLLGENWAPSAPVIRVLAFIGILQAPLYFQGTVIMAVGKPSWRLAILAINTLANVVAFLLVVRWGIVYVAAAFVIRGWILCPLPFLAVRKLIQVRLSDYLRELAAPVICSAIMAGGVAWLRSVLVPCASLPIVLAVCTFSGAAIYVLSVFLVRPSVAKEFLRVARSAVRPAR